ncbi:FAD/NAD(P)-binding domain-containing protein [Thozetella sp. PMI_491]|nr:FAD/NAD(P)-binding domain-containing protein [Thozetella sp. PMI_491]
MATSRPRIAIVGAGPGGLTMGLLLHQRNIPFTIFELRPKPTEDEIAQPSGMLDLHEVSGIAAIKECGLWDEFLPLTGECSEAAKISDRNGTILYEDEKAKAQRPEISRNNLTKLLSDKIPSNAIQWGYKLLSATTSDMSGSAQIELDFGAHGKHAFDMVVGADGAWSKVRPLVTEAQPHYAGLHLITVTVREITNKYPHLAKLVGSGSFAALGTGHNVVSQRGPIDSSRIYIMLSIDDEHFATTSGLAGKSPASAKEKLLSDDALLGTWGTPIKELVAVACDEEEADHPGEALDIRALYELPDDYVWNNSTSVTLIGDAAHLMRPNGEGVNLAMQDALLLSRAVGDAYEASGNDVKFFQSTLGPMLREYETALAARAKEEAEGTRHLSKIMYGEDAANSMATLFRRMSQRSSN